jgi:hypothetical protein
MRGEGAALSSKGCQIRAVAAPDPLAYSQRRAHLGQVAHKCLTIFLTLKRCGGRRRTGFSTVLPKVIRKSLCCARLVMVPLKRNLRQRQETQRLANGIVTQEGKLDDRVLDRLPKREFENLLRLR